MGRFEPFDDYHFTKFTPGDVTPSRVSLVLTSGQLNAARSADTEPAAAASSELWRQGDKGIMGYFGVDLSLKSSAALFHRIFLCVIHYIVYIEDSPSVPLYFSGYF